MARKQHAALHRRTVLETNILVAGWGQLRGMRDPSTIDTREASKAARQLQELYGTGLIATPVRIEFLAGATTSQELRLARAFLAEFEPVDGGSIPAVVWSMAVARASRIPRDGKPRHLGDCLIGAIAEHHGCSAQTHDNRFRG